MTSPSKGENLAKIVARRSHLSRRKAAAAIKANRVILNGRVAAVHDRFHPTDTLMLDDKPLTEQAIVTILFHKPPGYVVSRDPQGEQPSIYELLPPRYQRLQHVGRLDADSSGLLVLTNDGELHLRLSHPRYNKQKVYQIQLNKPLSDTNAIQIEQGGVSLDDGPSKFELKGAGVNWTVTMREGRNRQIRRTFDILGYTVIKLHRVAFGPFTLGDLEPGQAVAATV